MTKIAVIIGSTRQGRQTDTLAKWATKELQAKADADLVDLRDYPIPFLDEAISPRYNPERTPDPETKKWLDKVGAYDGYVIVTPEYNRSTSAVLKNALDVIAYEMQDKPVAIIAHGTSGGAQAVANLRMALPGIGAVSIPDALFFSDKAGDAISEDGELSKEVSERAHGPQMQLTGLLDKLVWYTEALASHKDKR